MKIQNISGDQQPYNVANGLGKLLIAQGTVREYNSAKKLSPKTVWGTATYAADEKPFISYKCASCNQHGHVGGPKVENFKFVHCFVTEAVPADIVADYKWRMQSWAPKGPAPKSVAQLAAEAMPEPFNRAHFE